MIQSRKAVRVGAVAVALMAGSLFLFANQRPAAAMHTDTEYGRSFGLGLHVGSSTGLSMKWFLGGGFGLQLNAGINQWFYGNPPGLRVEVDGVWHFSVARWPTIEMVIGPGVGGGVAWWRDHGYFDACAEGTTVLDPSGNVRVDSCGGPFGRGFFHFSTLFHRHHFDLFAEPGIIVGAGIPGRVVVDWDYLTGIRWYF